MFRGEFETAPLAACIFGVPSGARYHAEMQVLLDREAERWARVGASDEGVPPSHGKAVPFAGIAPKRTKRAWRLRGGS